MDPEVKIEEVKIKVRKPRCKHEFSMVPAGRVSPYWKPGDNVKQKLQCIKCGRSKKIGT